MPSPTDELIERLEKATEPDRTLDGAIALAFAFPQKYFGKDFSRVDGPDCYTDQATWGGLGDEVGDYIAPEYTASLDAAIALVERVLPDHEEIGLQIGRGHTNAYICSDTFRQEIGVDRYVGCGPTPALAILLALLHALKHKEGNNDAAS